MLVLSRKTNESIVIDGKIYLDILRFEGDSVKVGVKAPKNVTVYRKEIYDEILESNRAAAAGPNKKDTDDEDIKKLLKKMVKQRAESIEIYKKNNRTDLLEVEQNEYDILTSFLPKQMSEEETKKLCADLIAKLGASSVKDMGKIMGELKKSHSDEIDFSKAGSIIKELLNS